MKKTSIIIAIMTSVAILFVVHAWLTRDLLFNIVVVNRGPFKFDKVKVRFDGFYHSVGILSVSKGVTGGAVFGEYCGVWPKRISVSWVDAQNSELERGATVVVPGPLRVRQNEVLELVVEFKGGSLLAYPRVRESFEEKGLSYRYKDL